MKALYFSGCFDCAAAGPAGRAAIHSFFSDIAVCLTLFRLLLYRADFHCSITIEDRNRQP
jgi:hypothetical protein